MTGEEYAAWQQFMKGSRGHWTVDPVHDGVKRDLIVFRCDPQDHTAGAYVAIAGHEIRAGRFSDADPHFGDGSFTTDWGACFPDKIGDKCLAVTGIEKPGNAATAFAIERLGLGFLLAMTQGQDPYTS